MKLYFECEGSTYAIEMADVEKLPVTIDTAKTRVVVDNTNDIESAQVYGSVVDALQTIVDKFASENNANEIHEVNEHIAAGDYFHARMRNRWRGNVTESMTEPGVFTLSISSSLTENDLLSDDFVGSVFKSDLSYLFDYGFRTVKQEKNTSGNKWKKAIRAFYAGKTADEMRSATKDDYEGTKWDTDNHWKDFTITNKRMELLRGCYPTQHTLSSDTLRTGKNLKRFVNVLLATDDIIARADTKKGK